MTEHFIHWALADGWSVEKRDDGVSLERTLDFGAVTANIWGDGIDNLCVEIRCSTKRLDFRQSGELEEIWNRLKQAVNFSSKCKSHITKDNR